MSSLFTDLRYGIRSLTRSPGFSTVVVLTLALGIGANVAMFGIVDAVLLKGLPFPDRERLVLARMTYSGQMGWSVSSEDYYDYRDQVEAFQSLGAIRTSATEMTVTGGEEPERVPATRISVNLLQTLGVGPESGRLFGAADASASAPPVALISHRFRVQRFGDASDAVGSPLVVDGTVFTVVGVMPAGFFFLHDVDIWLPMWPGGPYTGVRRFHNWTVVGRLAAGATLEQARAQADIVSSRLQATYPESNADAGLDVSPLQDVLVDRYDEMLLTLMAAIGLVLVIACSNVAGLLLARGTGRAREFSVRTALGATRGRVARQLLGESLILAVAAGVLGMSLALWLQGVAVRALPMDSLGIDHLGISGVMLAFALALSLTTAVVFGLIPAWAAARTDPGEHLSAGTRTTSGSGSTRLRGALVVFQVALSVVLLVGSGLLVRSFMKLQSVDPGFRKERLLTAKVALPSDKYSDPRTRILFFTGLLDDIRNIPEIQAAGAVSLLPIKDGYSTVGAWNPEQPPAGAQDVVQVEQRKILPGYFETMGIPIVAGRDFMDLSAGRETEFVIIVNETMARGLFGNENPVGRQVAVDIGAGQPALGRVVGMVGDVRMTGLDTKPSRQMYIFYAQAPDFTLSLAVRSARDPSAIAGALRNVLKARDPDIPLGSVATMDHVIHDAMATPRALTTALTAFALAALLLSALGLYGVLAFHVIRRTHEIGIRMAMGATAPRTIGAILRRGMVLVAVGLPLGLGGALLLTRFLQTQLYEVRATDPATLVVVGVGLVLVALLACLVPAWRATRVDPVRALQAE